MVTEKDLEKKAEELVLSVGPKGHKRFKSLALKLFFILIFVFAISGIAYGTYQYFFEPRGQITNPLGGSETSRVIEIEGFTKNIPPERRYVWITVDVEKLKLCWPKRQVYKHNEPFKAKFYEGGPKGNFKVSIYAVDRGMHEDILKWDEERKITKSREGIPQIPARFKLDSIKLELREI